MPSHFMQGANSWLNFALGAVTAYTSPRLALVYGVVQYANYANTRDSVDALSIPQPVIDGAEYAFGYFLMTNFLQSFTNN